MQNNRREFIRNTFGTAAGIVLANQAALPQILRALGQCMPNLESSLP
jgi:hypothetical protein